MKYDTEMERDATWMSKDTWAAKHGSANLNLWHEMQYEMRVNSKPWWDDSDKEEYPKWYPDDSHDGFQQW